MLIEVSNGELVDKITILEIKKKKIKDLDKLKHVEAELEKLYPSYYELEQATGDRWVTLLHKFKHDLYMINDSLWEVEDKIRECERTSNFGDDFIKLARSVYMNNDKRAALKKEINELTRSEFEEVKSYEQY